MLSNAVFLLILSLRKIECSSDWVTVGGDFDHSGYKAESLGNVDTIEVAWKFNGFHKFSGLGVLVYKAKIYQISGDGTLNILDAKSGTKLKDLSISTTQVPMTQFIEPESGILFVATLGQVHAFNITEGAEAKLWSRDVDMALDMVPSSALNRLFVASGLSRKLLAFDMHSGDLLQNFGAGADHSLWLTLYNKTRLLAITDYQNVQSLREVNSAGDGSVVWSANSPDAHKVFHGPVMSGNVAFVNSNGSISAVQVDSVNQTIMWTASGAGCGSAGILSFSRDSQFLYRKCNADDIYKYGLVTGQFIQALRLPESYLNTIEVKPIVLDDCIISPRSKGLDIIDKQTGRVKASFSGDGETFSPSSWAYFDGLIYGVSTRSNIIYAFKPLITQLPSTTPQAQVQQATKGNSAGRDCFQAITILVAMLLSVSVSHPVAFL